MANYKFVDADKLDADLKKVADAIRAKGGYADPMVFPEEFVQEIGAISTGGDVTILENQAFELNFSAGDMQINLGESMAVRSGVIYKPEALLPENIRKGVEIAGIVGNMEVGGGSSADVRYVTFMNGTEVLYVKPVAVGDDCVDVLAKGLIETPTKETDVQYNYTYYGWGASNGGAANANILKNITEDKTVYAIFTATARLYTITFYDEDGTTVLATKQVAYGTVPSYTPTKDGVAFSHWTPTPAAVTGNASYTAVWSATLASGYCGANTTNVKWTLTTDGLLELTGSGKMKDYANPVLSSNIAPWYTDYREQINRVIVASGITHIGAHAFRRCDQIESVSLPSTLTSIGTSAFLSCSAMSDFSLPAGLTSLGEYSLQYCENLTSITIPSGITEIGRSTFSETGITNVTIPSAVKKIGTYAFNIAVLESVTFANPNGWWVSSDSVATSGTAVDVSDPVANVPLFKSTYRNYFWFRS